MGDKKANLFVIPSVFLGTQLELVMRYWKDFSDQRSTFEESWYADVVYVLLIAAAFAFAWYLAEQ